MAGLRWSELVPAAENDGDRDLISLTQSQGNPLPVPVPPFGRYGDCTKRGEREREKRGFQLPYQNRGPKSCKGHLMESLHTVVEIVQQFGPYSNKSPIILVGSFL